MGIAGIVMGVQKKDGDTNHSADCIFGRPDAVEWSNGIV